MSTIVLCHLTRCSNFPSLRHMKVLFFFSKIFSWIPIKGRKKVETNCEVWKKDQKEPIFPTEMIVWQIDIIFLYLMTFRANYRVTKQVLDWFTKLNKVYERSEQILRITRFLFKKGFGKICIFHQSIFVWTIFY